MTKYFSITIQLQKKGIADLKPPGAERSQEEIKAMGLTWGETEMTVLDRIDWIQLKFKIFKGIFKKFNEKDNLLKVIEK